MWGINSLKLVCDLASVRLAAVEVFREVGKVREPLSVSKNVHVVGQCLGRSDGIICDWRTHQGQGWQTDTSRCLWLDHRAPLHPLHQQQSNVHSCSAPIYTNSTRCNRSYEHYILHKPKNVSLCPLFPVWNLSNCLCDILSFRVQHNSNWSGYMVNM